MPTSKIRRLFSDWCSRLRTHGAGNLSHLHFRLYTRRGCHLCEHAKQELQAARRRHRFTVEEIDVDGDPELARIYGEQVPVVTLNGKIRFRGRLNSALLLRLLHGEAGKLAP